MTCAFILRAALLLAAALPLSARIPATNNNGNILTQIITPPGIAAITQTYTYDPLNRIAAAAESSAGSPWSRSYAYDRYGNRAVILAYFEKGTESVLKIARKRLGEDSVFEFER